ncbi:hypothetical protein SETIT_1G142000v2 [Setaria italica]|uniref:Uncharacterized protein n=1 Tax=Setaria italica TaxID=4555 RepID=A0A368PKJ2_SETIT|nr:hypothetical protein SETIT_1G142000v2 [Setaria italica]
MIHPRPLDLHCAPPAPAGGRSASPRSQPRSPRLRSPSDGPADLISPSNGARGKRPGAACARSPPGRGREGRGEADKS